MWKTRAAFMCCSFFLLRLRNYDQLFVIGWIGRRKKRTASFWHIQGDFMGALIYWLSKKFKIIFSARGAAARRIHKSKVLRHVKGIGGDTTRNTDQWTFTIVCGFLWSNFIVAHWFFGVFAAFFRQQSEDLGTERGIIFFRCFSRLLRNDFFAFAFIAWKFFISYALFRHNSSRLLAERTEKMFSRRKKKKQLATRKCLPMMTINILMRNANELTSTCYKSCGHTATSLQLRPVKKATKNTAVVSGFTFAIFISRFSAFCQAEKKNTTTTHKEKWFILYYE